MEIIKYNEILNKKKHLFSVSFFKMLDNYRPFDKYYNSFKLLMPFLGKNMDLFDVRIYYDISVENEIKSYIEEYSMIEFYKCNYQKLRIKEYHHGEFGKILGYLPLFYDPYSYEYVYITDVLFRPEWINFNDINFVIKNKI